MNRITFLLVLCFFSCGLYAQNYGGAVPEFQFAYFGEFFFHPGAKAGISFPFTEWSKEKMQETKRRGVYAIVKQKELRVGGNVGFYNIVRNHTGYFSNLELTFRRSKFYSFRPEKKGHLELGLGVGYFRYRLHGTTFKPTEEGFEEIRGNGGAFMPSFSVGYGGTFRWNGERNARYFLKSSAYGEVPFGTALQIITALEAGVSIPLNIKGFEVKQGERVVKELRKKN